jgi:hypothetical protein
MVYEALTKSASVTPVATRGNASACLNGGGAAPPTAPTPPTAPPANNGGGGNTTSKSWTCTAQGSYTKASGGYSYPYSVSAFGFGETKAIASIQAETSCSSHLMGMAIASGGSISIPCATTSCNKTGG